ncbi:MAG: N-acetyl-gamma-glutamyl-phosphate reductase [Candidatus Margulisiibacteriota bacterium]
MVTVGIVGATGYTGIELLKLLRHHPEVKITYIGSRQNGGIPYGTLFPGIDISQPLQPFEPAHLPNVDVLFLALPHGQAHPLWPQLRAFKGRIIDLSADFRLRDPVVYEAVYKEPHQAPEGIPQFAYGLPEITRDTLADTRHVANPGCYATCILLGLYPLAGLVPNAHIVVDAKSGISGAGRAAKVENLLAEATEQVTAYATFRHRHAAEIRQLLGRDFSFSPHVVPMSRGMMADIYVTGVSRPDYDQIVSVYTQQYAHEPFVTVLPGWDRPSTRDVTGTNRCFVSLTYDDSNQTVGIVSVIDNLIKGASGQAIQNMNIMLGLPETTGLMLEARYV